jgi:hypothetical protein
MLMICLNAKGHVYNFSGVLYIANTLQAEHKLSAATWSLLTKSIPRRLSCILA